MNKHYKKEVAPIRDVKNNVDLALTEKDSIKVDIPCLSCTSTGKNAETIANATATGIIAISLSFAYYIFKKA